MKYRFEVTHEGLVEAVLEDDAPLLGRALEDSLGSRPPRGAPSDGPTTYWIDHALNDLDRRRRDGTDQPFAAGNMTYLRLRDGFVEARYDFDPPDGDDVDMVDVDDFIALLEAWRHHILDFSPGANERVPATDVTRPPTER